MKNKNDRDRYNVLWAPGKSVEAHEQAKAHGLKHIPYDRIDADTDWRVYEIPPGIAKKEEEWIRAHPHFGGEFEPESFGEVIPVDGSALAVSMADEWYQKFLNLDEAETITFGAGAVGGVLDNGFNAGVAIWLEDFITEALAFCTKEPGIVTGGSHGMPVMGLARAVAFSATAISYKIGTTSDVTCSWNDVSNACLDAKKRGLKALNLSYGSTSSTSSLLSSTIKTLYDAGICLIVAAGNSGGATAFPANNQYAYAVSALDTNGQIAGFSCRGKINVSAPGVSLLTSNNSGGWSSFSGTSGAAPLVFGTILLVLAKNPGWTGVQAADWVCSTAIPQSPSTDYGKGWANAAKAVGAALPAAPSVPTGLKVTEVTASSALLSVDPMDGPVGIEFDQGPGPYYVGRVVLPGTQLRWTGLNAKTAYSVVACSYDYLGKSAYTTRVNFTTLSSDPTTPPPTTTMPAPTIVQLTSTSITFAWTPISGATGYELYQGAGYKFQQVGPTVTQYQWTALKPGTDYRVAVKPLGGVLSEWLAFKTQATDAPPPPPPPLSPIEQGIVTSGLTGSDADLARAINGVMPADATINAQAGLLAWHLSNGAIIAFAA